MTSRTKYCFRGWVIGLHRVLSEYAETSLTYPNASSWHNWSAGLNFLQQSNIANIITGQFATLQKRPSDPHPASAENRINRFQKDPQWSREPVNLDANHCRETYVKNQQNRVNLKISAIYLTTPPTTTAWPLINHASFVYSQIVEGKGGAIGPDPNPRAMGEGGSLRSMLSGDNPL